MRNVIFAILILPFGCDSSSTEEKWCNDAHTDLTKMIEGAKKFAPPSDQTNFKSPNKSEFVKTCKTLPVDLQKCLVVTYAQENKKRCLEVEKTLDVETSKTFQKLVSGK